MRALTGFAVGVLAMTAGCNLQGNNANDGSQPTQSGNILLVTGNSQESIPESDISSVQVHLFGGQTQTFTAAHIPAILEPINFSSYVSGLVPEGESTGTVTLNFLGSLGSRTFNIETTRINGVANDFVEDATNNSVQYLASPSEPLDSKWIGD